MAYDAQRLVRPGDPPLLLGAHLALKKPRGLAGSVETALRIKATAFMVFLGPPQNTHDCAVPSLRAPEALRLWTDRGGAATAIAVHFRYVLNPASPDPKKGNFAAAFFDRELTAMEQAGLSLCCFHPGSALKTDRTAALLAMGQRLGPVFARHPAVRIAVETMAGKGGEVCVGLTEAGWALRALGSLPNVGVCLDTCHLWDAGEDLCNTAGFLDRVAAAIGFDRVFLVHLNDSKNPRGSAKDRHADLGQGFIGFKALARLAGCGELAGAPKILETPDPGDESVHAREISLIRAGLGL